MSHGASDPPPDAPAPERSPIAPAVAEPAADGRDEAAELAKMVRRLMSILVLTGGYLVITLAVPDWKLVRADAEIPLALAGQAAGIKVQLSIFLTFAPLILVTLLVYLHLFVGQMVFLETRQVLAPAIYIFTMARPAARIVSDLVLYAFVPAILAWFTWKTVFLKGAWLLALATAVVALACAGLFLTRARIGGRSTRYRIGLGALASILLVMLGGASVLYAVGWDEVLRWRRIDLVRAQLGVSEAVPYVDLRNLDLRHADARFAVLTGADLRYSRLDQVDLSDADLSKVDLSDALLRSAKLARAKLDGAILDRAKLDDADLRQASLAGTRLAEASLVAATLTRAKGDGVDFSGADLRQAKLRNARLTRALFVEADLSDVDAVLAELKQASFGAADLSRANFDDADVGGALFALAVLFDANFKHAKGLPEAQMPGARFCRTTMPEGVRDDDCGPGLAKP